MLSILILEKMDIPLVVGVDDDWVAILVDNDGGIGSQKVTDDEFLWLAQSSPKSLTAVVF